MEAEFAREILSRLPLAEAVLSLWRWVADPLFLLSVFARHRGQGYEKESSFRVWVQLIADALLEHQGSGKKSFARGREQGLLTASVQAVYQKLGRVPLGLSEAWLAESTARVRPGYPWRRERPGRVGGGRRSMTAPTGSAGGGCSRCCARPVIPCAGPTSTRSGPARPSWTGRWTGWWPTGWSTRCPMAASRCPGARRGRGEPRQEPLAMEVARAGGVQDRSSVLAAMTTKLTKDPPSPAALADEDRSEAEHGRRASDLSAVRGLSPRNCRQRGRSISGAAPGRPGL